MTQPCRYRIIYLIILNKRISIKIRVITINKLSPIIFRSFYNADIEASNSRNDQLLLYTLRLQKIRFRDRRAKLP